MKTKKPWLTDEGKYLSDDELKIISKTWTPETWEAYMQSLEHEEDEERFITVATDSVDQTSNEDFKALITDPIPLEKDLTQIVMAAVDKLPERQKEVIFDSYWMNISEREQAKKHGVQRAAVYFRKRRAKNNLKKLLPSDSANLEKWKTKK